MIRCPRLLSNERMQQTGKFYHYRCKNGSIKGPPRPGEARIEGVKSYFIKKLKIIKYTLFQVILKLYQERSKSNI